MLSINTVDLYSEIQHKETPEAFFFTNYLLSQKGEIQKQHLQIKERKNEKYAYRKNWTVG